MRMQLVDPVGDAPGQRRYTRGVIAPGRNDYLPGEVARRAQQPRHMADRAHWEASRPPSRLRWGQARPTVIGRRQMRHQSYAGSWDIGVTPPGSSGVRGRRYRGVMGLPSAGRISDAPPRRGRQPSDCRPCRGSATDGEGFVDDVGDRDLVAGHHAWCGAPDEVCGQLGLDVLAEEAGHADLPVIDDPLEAVVSGHGVELEDTGEVR